MTLFALITLGLPAMVLLGLAALRLADARADRAAWARLGATAQPVLSFHRDMLAGLPEPARRYFGYVIAEGAPLHQVVRIEMRGQIGMGDQNDPRYRAMRADQILAPPHGLLWRLRAGAIGGSDAVLPETSWTRFRLFGLVPVVRAGQDQDHRRSAFGRVVAEAAFWAPGALLPGDHVRWDATGPDSARATVSFAGLIQSVQISVAADGRPVRVIIDRWSNANPERVWRLQPFGGTLGDFRPVAGYRLPFRVEGGNHFGTDAYFPFYRARITRITFPGRACG